MPTPLNIGTRDVPLRLARTLTDKVNESWESGELLAKATPVTRELLTFWLDKAHVEMRYTNFHQGQRQAILNAIYLHEVLGVKAVKDIERLLCRKSRHGSKTTPWEATVRLVAGELRMKESTGPASELLSESISPHHREAR